MLAQDLSAALQTLPEAWARVLPGWTPERLAGVAARVQAVSGERPIAPEDPLRALRLVPPEAVKVVIIGQDPYPTAGHADGLAFSAGQGRPVSLRRVFSVLAADRPGYAPPPRWALDGWARQGVLLLNPVLTVEVGAIGSHMDCGWQTLTSEIVSTLCACVLPPHFLLWGSRAQAFFDAACPPGAEVPTLRTRHPSNDFQRRFMAEGSHFAATAHRVDWWARGAD